MLGGHSRLEDGYSSMVIVTMLGNQSHVGKVASEILGWEDLKMALGGKAYSVIFFLKKIFVLLASFQYFCYFSETCLQSVIVLILSQLQI